MKMVKSLLLVSAAGLVAVSGAQAADLPVKAKPVEYVKVCSLYGVGFYYIPGTDICLKVGAYFRAEYAYGNIGTGVNNLTALDWSNTTAEGQRTRLVGGDNYSMRSRAFIFLDSRQQTAYGTLRAYMNIGHSGDTNNAQAVYANRAFIQLAGFTWGLATSYYDFYSSPATSYTVPFSSDTGDGGYKVAAYTAQLGNGLSASLSFEEPRRSSIVNTSVASNIALLGVVSAGNDQHKVRVPDIVANLRIDQAWGSAQIMGALHEASGGYYGASVGGGTCAAGIALTAGNTCSGHPSSKWGFAVGAGIKVNFPMIGPGDYFQAQVNYTQGATRYVAFTPGGSGNLNAFGEGAGQGSSVGFGLFNDAVYNNGSSVELTTAWGVNAAYEHFWTPSLRTSLVGGYQEFRFNDNATAMICANTTANATANSLSGFSGPCTAGIANWSAYTISSRTQWNITKDFYVGLEGFYGHLNTAFGGRTALYTALATGAQPTGLRTLEDQNVYVYRMRVHRDLVP